MALRQRGWGQPLIHAAPQWTGVVNNATNQNQAAAALQAWAAAYNAGHPAAPAAASSAPAPSRHVDPFLTPEEQLAWDQTRGNAAQQVIDLNYNLSKSQADTAYGITQAQQQAEKDTATTIDNMIGRGLYQSSIKDGDIADVTRTSALRQDYLKSALSSMDLYTKSRVQSITDSLAQQQVSINQQMIANAQGIEPTPDPTPATNTAAAPAAPAAVPYVAQAKPVVASVAKQPTTGGTATVAPQSGYAAPAKTKSTLSISKGKTSFGLPKVPSVAKVKVPK